MKKLLPFLLVLMGLIATASSCNSKVNLPSEEDKELQVDANTDMIPHNLEEDCHGVRKTIFSINDKEGEIMLISDQVIISVPPGNKRYTLCDAADELKVEGLNVKFSGVVLETFPNERLMGTPFRLSKIDIVR